MVGNQEAICLKSILEKIMDNTYQEGKSFYLKNSKQILEELILSFSKIYCLLYSNIITPKFLGKLTRIYCLYRWIIERINPNQDLFTIPSISKLNRVQKELILLINDIASLLNSGDYPHYDKYYIKRVQQLIKTFKSISI